MVAEIHLAVGTCSLVIFVPEGYVVVIYLENAMVADRHFMGIPAEVFDHLPGSSERSLCIHHPVFDKQAFDD